MRSKLHIVLASLVVMMYVTATIGVGVHSCLKEGSSHIFLFNSDSPCHHADGSCHDGSCCSTTLYLVNDPTVPEDYSVVTAVVSLLIVHGLGMADVTDHFHQLFIGTQKTLLTLYSPAELLPGEPGLSLPLRL